MAINENITQFTATPLRTNPATFSADTDTYHTELSAFIVSCNTWSTQANQTQTDINAKSQNVDTKSLNVDNKAVQVANDAQTAEQAKNEILGYVVPTDAVDSQAIRDLKDQNIINANFPFSGYIQKKSKEDGLYFEESTNFIASIGNKGQFLNFNGVLVDMTTHVDYVAGKGLVKDLSDFIPETQIVSGASPVTVTPVSSGDYAIYDRPELQDNDFSLNTDGWTPASGGILTNNNSQLNVSGLAGDTAYAGVFYTPVTIGEKYIIKFDLVSTTGTLSMYIGTTSTGLEYTSINTLGTNKITITATSSNLYLSAYGFGSGGVAVFDNISVKPYHEVYRATEDIPIDIPLTDTRFQTTEQSPSNYINNRKHSQVTNQVLVTQTYNTVTKTYLGLHAEVAFNDVSAEDFVRQIMTLNDFTQEGTCYRKGDNLHILVSVEKMDNLGLYHYSLNGLGHAKASDDKFFNDTTVSFTSVADCFDPTKLLANSGKISSGKSGSPEGRYVDIVYSNNISDYRLSAEKANLPEILAGGNNAMISNQSLAGSGIANEEFIESTLQVTTGTVNTLEVQDGTNYTIGKDVQIWNGLTAYRKRITGINSNTLTLDSTINKTAVDFIISGGTKPVISQGSSLKSEILSSPSRYATILRDRLNEGKECLLIANLFDDNGNSNIPDGVKTTFKLNKKVLDQLQVLKTSDLGATWTVESVTFDSSENTITFSSAPSANDMILVQNTALNAPSFQSDPLPIEWLGNKSIASNQAGSNISYSQGYVSTSDKLENRNLEDNFLDENLNIQGLPIQNTHTLSTSSNGVKMLSSLAKLDGELVYQMFTEEAKSTASNWDRGNYDELTNGTTDDNNTTEVRTSVQIFRTGEQI